MPMIGEFSRIDPVDPWKAAEPKVKIPPSRATNQYPSTPPDGELAMSNQVDFKANLDWKSLAATSTDPPEPLTRTVWARRLPSAAVRAITFTDCNVPTL